MEGSVQDSTSHTQECKDNAFCFHAATGGDAECICEPEFVPPHIVCCETAIATGGAYHRPGCRCDV